MFFTFWHCGKHFPFPVDNLLRRPGVKNISHSSRNMANYPNLRDKWLFCFSFPKHLFISEPSLPLQSRRSFDILNTSICRGSNVTQWDLQMLNLVAMWLKWSVAWVFSQGSCSAGILPEEQKAQLKDICNLKQFFLVLQRHLIRIMLLSVKDWEDGVFFRSC